MTNKEVIRSYWEAKWNERSPEKLAEFLTPDVVFYGPAIETSGIEEYLQLYRSILSALGDTQVVIEDLIEEQDKVVAQVAVKGVHVGELLGVPASGRQFTFKVTTVFHLRGGRIAEEHQIYDTLDLLVQLGLDIV